MRWASEFESRAGPGVTRSLASDSDSYGVLTVNSLRAEQLQRQTNLSPNPDQKVKLKHWSSAMTWPAPPSESRDRSRENLTTVLTAVTTDEPYPSSFSPAIFRNVLEF